MHTISDADDPRLAGFRNLPGRSGVVSDTIIVESELAVRRLFETGVRVHAVLAVDKRAASLDVPADVPLYICPKALLDSVVGFPMHRGAIALAERPTTRVEALELALTRPGTVICVSGVSDPANLGAIARNTCALGAAGLLIDPRGGDIYARKSIRTSMGNVFAQTVVVSDMVPAIAFLKRAHPDLVIAAATLSEGSIDVATYGVPERLLLVLGNEGAGVPADVLKLCDLELTIPMQAGADSLNVAAASAVFSVRLAPPGPLAPRDQIQRNLPARSPITRPIPARKFYDDQAHPSRWSP